MKKDPNIEAAKLAKMKNPDWRLHSGWPPETVAVEVAVEKPRRGRPAKTVVETPSPIESADGNSDGN